MDRVSKDGAKVAVRNGWKVRVNNQAGLVTATRNDVELRVSTETFNKCIVIPCTIHDNLSALEMKPDEDWTEADRKFWNKHWAI